MLDVLGFVLVCLRADCWVYGLGAVVLCFGFAFGFGVLVVCWLVGCFAFEAGALVLWFVVLWMVVCNVFG